MSRPIIFAVLGLLTFAVSWYPAPSWPIPPGTHHINWSGWPFLCTQNIWKLSPSGGNEMVGSKYAMPELLIDLGVAITIVTTSYFGLTRFAFRMAPRVSLLDILSLTVGISISVAYFSINPDAFLWNLRITPSDGTVHQMLILKRPIFQNLLTCLLIVLSGYSSTMMLFSSRRRITKR